MNEMPVLGAQLEYPLGERDKYCVANRAYHFPLRWEEIETQPGVYTIPASAYDTINRLDKKLGRSNYQLILGTRTCPKFYRRYEDKRNSAPKPEHYQAFARFCEAICLALNPWGIELWNEPEFDAAESAGFEYYFGGFGTDAAGYGRMVKTVNNHLKRKQPQVQIIAGASFGLVDGDRALLFLSEAVAAGMKADYYSWHAYWKYSDMLYGGRAYYQALWYSLKAYEIFPVRQIVSETSVRRDTWRPELAAHRASQADLLRFWLRYMDSHPIDSVLWYTLADNGWEHTDLVNKGVEWSVYQVWRDF